MKKLFFLLSIMLFSCSLRDLLGPRKEQNPHLPPPGYSYLTNYNSMQLVGDFQGWNLLDFEGTKMQLVDDWVWEKTWFFSSSTQINFKFVPNRTWDPAFGSNSNHSGLEGPVDTVRGPGTHLVANIPQAGYWKFTFNENLLYYWITLEEIPPGTITGLITFSDDTIPPYPKAYLRVYTAGWDTLFKESESDTLTGEFTVQGLPDRIYNLIALSPGYIPDTVTQIEISGGNQVDVGTISLERATGVAIIIDGYIDVSEGWIEIAESEISNYSGANMGKLYIAYDSLYLYLGFTTNNDTSWTIAYGTGMDVREGGFQEQDTLDAWHRKIGFSGDLAVDYELYFYWNGTTIDAINLCEWTGSQWSYSTPDSVNYAYSGNPNIGIQGFEIGIPWTDLGNIPSSIKIRNWIAGGMEYDSAVDGAPDDPSLHDSQTEWTDIDIFTTFVTFEF